MTYTLILHGTYKCTPHHPPTSHHFTSPYFVRRKWRKRTVSLTSSQLRILEDRNSYTHIHKHFHITYGLHLVVVLQVEILLVLNNDVTFNRPSRSLKIDPQTRSQNKSSLVQTLTNDVETPLRISEHTQRVFSTTNEWVLNGVQSG